MWSHQTVWTGHLKEDCIDPKSISCCVWPKQSTITCSEKWEKNALNRLCPLAYSICIYDINFTLLLLFINIDRINRHSVSAARGSVMFAAGGSAVGLLTGQTRATLAASYQHKILYVYREGETWLDMFAPTCVILGLHPSLFSGSAASYTGFPRHNTVQSNLPRPNWINVKNIVRVSIRMTGAVSGPMMAPAGSGWLFTVWTHLRMKNNLFYYLKTLNWFSFALQLISQCEDFSL